jgi:hypothetical protein
MRDPLAPCGLVSDVPVMALPGRLREVTTPVLRDALVAMVTAARAPTPISPSARANRPVHPLSPAPAPAPCPA